MAGDPGNDDNNNEDDNNDDNDDDVTQVYQPRESRVTSLVYDDMDRLIFVKINQVSFYWRIKDHKVYCNRICHLSLNAQRLMLIWLCNILLWLLSTC